METLSISEQEQALAKENGFKCEPDTVRGAGWCRFVKGSLHVWRRDGWQTAYLINNHFTDHFKCEDLEQAFKRCEYLELTLANYISKRFRSDENGWQAFKGWMGLTVEDRAGIANLLGGHKATKLIIKEGLKDLSRLKNCGIFERVHWCRHVQRWSYCAGQEYQSEVSYIRRRLLNNFSN